jgi:translation initiation factor 2B subunit (eIF-2B alpha/beta/delta family)
MPSKSNVAKPRAVSPARVEFLRNESIRTMREMEEAIVRTRAQMKVMETTIRRARRLIETGRPAREVAGTVNAAEARLATSAIIREVQAARHRAQQAQFKLSAAEGATMAEIARRWGVSRQLVSRMVKEPSARRKKT